MPEFPETAGRLLQPADWRVTLSDSDDVVAGDADAPLSPTKKQDAIPRSDPCTRATPPDIGLARRETHEHARTSKTERLVLLSRNARPPFASSRDASSGRSGIHLPRRRRGRGTASHLRPVGHTGPRDRRLAR